MLLAETIPPLTALVAKATLSKPGLSITVISSFEKEILNKPVYTRCYFHRKGLG